MKTAAGDSRRQTDDLEIVARERFEGMTAAGWIAFGLGHLGGAMVPSDAQAYASFESQREPPAHYPAFSALVYSLENSLPFVALGQSNYWQPRRAGEG